MSEREVKTPLGAVRLETDAQGRLVRASDPCGRSVCWEYDAAGQVTSQEMYDGAFPVVQSLYHYDCAGAPGGVAACARRAAVGAV